MSSVSIDSNLDIGTDWECSGCKLNWKLTKIHYQFERHLTVDSTIEINFCLAHGNI